MSLAMALMIQSSVRFFFINDKDSYHLSLLSNLPDAPSKLGQACLMNRTNIENTTSSSILGPKYLPKFAIDGKLSDSDTTKYYYHSAYKVDALPWFQLEFKQFPLVVKVHIINRVHKNLKHLMRLRDVEIRIGNHNLDQKDSGTGNHQQNSLCGVYKGPATTSGGVEEIKCKRPMTGKYLAVQIQENGGKRILTINEIRVYARC